ncbi:MAG: trigger factor [Thiobacillaceae bacterium]|jgi:trigger factor
MQSNLEVLGPIERRLDISVPLAAVEAEVQARLKNLARKVRMDGFRPGKAPLSAVARQHGAEIRQEVLSVSLQAGFNAAVQEHNLQVAGIPRFENKQGGDGQEVLFSALFEVYPEIEIGDLGSGAIMRPQTSVTDADVDKTVEVLRKQRREFRIVERSAQEDDRVKFDFAGTLDGQPFEGGEGKGYITVLGEGRFLKDFEANLIGISAGETKAFDITFPVDYPAAHLAGKQVHFEVTLHEISEPWLPEINADFAKAMGVADGDLAKLREEIKANLEREVKRRVQTHVKQQVMNLLSDRSDFEVPKSLIAMEVERLMKQAQQDAASRGLKELALSADMFNEQASRRVRLGIIVAEVIKTQGLSAKPEQIRAMVEELAQSYEEPKEVVNWYFENPERLQEVENMALEDNVVAWVLSQAKVNDVATSFDDLMGRAQA